MKLIEDIFKLYYLFFIFEDKDILALKFEL